MPRTKKIEKVEYIKAIGRRKEAVARVRLILGKGETIVNDQPIDKYFVGEDLKKLYLKPFELTGTVERYHATIKCVGGGKVGQLTAIVHALSRALSLANRENYRPALKKAKLLTRDSRTRERRKVGMGGKARRKKQSPKR